ncbi:MAG: ABC transporter permease [Chrysiogenales bacterium]|nr:MAG: ABC transporter permease [Chrysiogenales bacterium]
MVIVGFSVIFTAESRSLYKVGVIGVEEAVPTRHDAWMKAFREIRYIEFIHFESEDDALKKLRHHRIDLLINPATATYWSSDTSPSGYVVERLLISSGAPAANVLKKERVTDAEIPYIEWLFPGILGMNIMFSALFGVGYVVVTYRKNGVLKRMSATPLRPWEFITAQILSRMFLLLATTSVVFAGCKLLYGFQVRGSYMALILVFLLGGFSMISLALVVASRSASEEFAGGILNLITWPMMFLSEVWFSLEGSRPWVQKASKVFPLTQMIDAARMIMNDGAGIGEVRSQLGVLFLMSTVFIITGSLLFTWQKK